MTDILLNSDNDVQIVNGDFVTGDSLLQNQRLILETAKGEWKESPTTGVGLFEFLNDENPDALLREIRAQMTLDGMTVTDLNIDNGKIYLNAQ